MGNNNQKSNGGGCFGFIIFVIIIAFVIKGGCSGDVNNDGDKNVSKKITEGTSEEINDFNKDTSEESQIKFLESGKKFYDMYMDYFGEDFSIEDEPFEFGEYKGKNEGKYRELEEVLKDMCMYYSEIEKERDRYDILAEIPFSMYEYTYNVREMLSSFDGVNNYDDELFTIEYSDFIVY